VKQSQVKQSRSEVNVIMPEIQCALSREGARVFRNNVGLFTTIDGRKVRTGLCVGSADLIGWYKGRFLACEVKVPGKKPKPHQQNFLDQVNLSGGIGFYATSAEESVDKLREFGEG